MSYGTDPEDHLYGFDEQEDRWERQYADYLEDQIEAQYAAEMDAEYAASMALTEEILRQEEMASTHDHGDHSKNPHHHSIEPQEQPLAHQLLHLPLGNNEAQAATVGEYLGLLLSTLWLQAEGFSGKRPFGNSDWQYPVYIAMVKGGLATGTVYEDNNCNCRADCPHSYEELDDWDQESIIAADELILQAIRLAYDHGRWMP